MSENSEPVDRMTVHFSGHVQGVGFRYSVLQAAKGFEVTGYVQNLNDGRVALVGEGEKAELEAFLEAIRDRMTGFIRNVERVDERGPRAYRGFLIR